MRGQICPACGRIEKRSISQRIHDLPCGYKDDSDHAASPVILERGSQKVWSERPELMLVDKRPLQPSAHGLQAAWSKQEAPHAREG